YTARASRAVPMTALVGQATLVAAAFAIVLSPLLPGGLAGLVPSSPLDWALIVSVGVTSFYLGPYLYFRAIEVAGLVLPALLMTAIPVFTVALGVLVDRTLPPWLSLAGIPIATLGAILALQGPHDPWTTDYAASAAGR
ncbi:MAG: DMT family transporter, partial [Thermoplasmata archaeon]|nr:DMT family transporter [Thermoplasmata archaeon]